MCLNLTRFNNISTSFITGLWDVGLSLTNYRHTHNFRHKVIKPTFILAKFSQGCREQGQGQEVLGQREQAQVIVIINLIHVLKFDVLRYAKKHAVEY